MYKCDYSLIEVDEKGMAFSAFSDMISLYSPKLIPVELAFKAIMGGSEEALGNKDKFWKIKF